MNLLKLIVVIFLLIFIIRWVLYNSGLTDIMMKDGSTVTVRRQTDETEEVEVASRLAKLEKVLKTFCTNVDDPLVQRIASRWDGRLSENSIMMAREAAYTTNKKHISMCTRDKDGRLVDWETSVFVALHELAHIGTDEKNHTKLFWTNNKKLLILADRTGLLKYRNYSQMPTMICGHKINYNPASCFFQGSCASPWAQALTTGL